MGTSFWGGAASGLVAGMAAGNAYRRQAREDEEAGWKREDRERNAALYDEWASIIRKYSAGAGGEGSGAGDAPQAPPQPFQQNPDQPSVDAQGNVGPAATLSQSGMVPPAITPDSNPAAQAAAAVNPAAPAAAAGPSLAGASAPPGGAAARAGLGPVDAEAPAQPAWAQRMEQLPPSEKVAFGFFSQPSILKNPQAMNEMAEAALRAKNPQAIEFLKQAHIAARENGIEAMQALVAGRPQEAVQIFNASGKAKVEGVEAAGDGKWTVTWAGGQKETFDPRQVMRSRLDPKDFFAAEREDKKVSLEERRTAATEGLYAAHGRAYDAQRDYYLAGAGLRDAQAQAGGFRPGSSGSGSRSGSGAKGDKADAKEHLPVYKEIGDIAVGLEGDQDPVTKKRTPNEVSTRLQGLATRVWRGAFENAEGSQQQMDPATAVEVARAGQIVTRPMRQGEKVMAIEMVKYKGNYYPIHGAQWRDITKEYNAAQAKQRQATGPAQTAAAGGDGAGGGGGGAALPQPTTQQFISNYGLGGR